MLRFFRISCYLTGCCICSSISGQTNSSYSIFVGGHAYGAHAGTNIGLHPPFLAKLHENVTEDVAAIFLTGDIVNVSTTASWLQIAKELSDLGLTSYYVMGNHDYNAVGIAEFKKKHGGTYYSFNIHKELFIVLNSPESDRSISSAQLKFLDEILKNNDNLNQRVFIFFHEVIWNSLEKYKLVRSNSRSRYALIRNVSNFWQSVFPMITAYPNRKFFLFAGDVGGNPDAIAASYDRWGNVTLVSSGMGEVPDENFLKVNVLPDTVSFTLIPLNAGVQMKSITWYNVPEKPEKITGKNLVNPPESMVRYQVSPVENATGYQWTFSNGISGISQSVTADLSFEDKFQAGQIAVRAVNDGFGESDTLLFNVRSFSFTLVREKKVRMLFDVQQNQQSIQINYLSDKRLTAKMRIFNSNGRLLYGNDIQFVEGLNTKIIDENSFSKGLIFIELWVDDKKLCRKMVLK